MPCWSVRIIQTWTMLVAVTRLLVHLSFPPDHPDSLSPSPGLIERYQGNLEALTSPVAQGSHQAAATLLTERMAQVQSSNVLKHDPATPFA